MNPRTLVSIDDVPEAPQLSGIPPTRVQALAAADDVELALYAFRHGEIKAEGLPMHQIVRLVLYVRHTQG